MKLHNLRLDPRKRKLLQGAHDDGRPALVVTEIVEVTSPTGDLTDSEKLEIQALAAAFGAEVEND
jgi:hypothetical protein